MENIQAIMVFKTPDGEMHDTQEGARLHMVKKELADFYISGVSFDVKRLILQTIIEDAVIRQLIFNLCLAASDMEELIAKEKSVTEPAGEPADMAFVEELISNKADLIEEELPLQSMLLHGLDDPRGEGV